MSNRNYGASEDPSVSVMFRSYEYLRQEILNSIGWQNRVLTAAVPIISVILGLGLTVSERYDLLLIIIPLAVIGLTSFWLVEQTRMMRAGDFLQLVENEINSKTGGAYLLRENWLRRRNISWHDPHRIHHFSIFRCYWHFLFSQWYFTVASLGT